MHLSFSQNEKQGQMICSSLTSVLDSEEVLAAAETLDMKLIAIAHARAACRRVLGWPS
jgi:hypothetical protein